jgi:apolipoprotein N-acyltransferase
LERQTLIRREDRDSAQRTDSEIGAPPVKCAPLICFEDTFPGAARESAQDDIDFLINLTNDGWFQESAEQRQHLANAVFRAVENGVPLLRCANNGVTCLVDRRGRLEKIFRDARGSEYGPGTMSFEIPLLAPAAKSAPTFYNRHGDWFGWSCVGVALVLLVRKFTAIQAIRRAKPGARPSSGAAA